MMGRRICPSEIIAFPSLPNQSNPLDFLGTHPDNDDSVGEPMPSASIRAAGGNERSSERSTHRVNPFLVVGPSIMNHSRRINTLALILLALGSSTEAAPFYAAVAGSDLEAFVAATSELGGNQAELFQSTENKTNSTEGTSREEMGNDLLANLRPRARSGARRGGRVSRGTAGDTEWVCGGCHDSRTGSDRDPLAHADCDPRAGLTRDAPHRADPALVVPQAPEASPLGWPLDEMGILRRVARPDRPRWVDSSRLPRPMSPIPKDLPELSP